MNEENKGRIDEDGGESGTAEQLTKHRPPDSGEGGAQAEPEEVSGTDWKAEARKWEKLAKRDAKTLKAYEEQQAADKEAHETALADAIARAERAESRVSELQAEADRQTAIKELSALEGVPPELLEHFATPEEMEAFTADWKKAGGQNNKVHAVAPAWSSSRIIRNDGTPTSPQSAFVDFMRDRIL